jgi:hypothetical protein
VLCNEESVPVTRMADVLFEKILRQPGFHLIAHGEARLPAAKSWYFEHEPVPASP